MFKPTVVIQSPISTVSGYGEMSRDIARTFIETGKYNVILIPTAWGATPMNALDDENPRDKMLIEKIHIGALQLPGKPDIFIQVTVPNEFQPSGVYNIGYTAGIETTLVSKEWIDGCNRMDMVLTISEHSKNVLLNTVFSMQDQHGNKRGEHKITKPVEVVPTSIDTSVFKPTDVKNLKTNVKDMFIDVKEKFCFLFVGHWLRGGIGEDRKNVGMLIKLFCEAFQTVPTATRPALVLKTSAGSFSVLDREEILDKINSVRHAVGANAPNVYLIHGDLNPVEMNSLYNHPKIKAHVSFTKGEGQGIPLLEASVSGKPVIASGWSGQVDFLNPEEAILVAGELKPIDAGSVWDGVLIKESLWFNIDEPFAKAAMEYIFKNYNEFLPKSKSLGQKNTAKFNHEVIAKKTFEILDNYLPKPVSSRPATLKLPTLKKISI